MLLDGSGELNIFNVIPSFIDITVAEIGIFVSRPRPLLDTTAVYDSLLIVTIRSIRL